MWLFSFSMNRFQLEESAFDRRNRSHSLVPDDKSSFSPVQIEKKKKSCFQNKYKNRRDFSPVPGLMAWFCIWMKSASCSVASGFRMSHSRGAVGGSYSKARSNYCTAHCSHAIRTGYLKTNATLQKCFPHETHVSEMSLNELAVAWKPFSAGKHSTAFKKWENY